MTLVVSGFRGRTDIFEGGKDARFNTRVCVCVGVWACGRVCVCVCVCARGFEGAPVTLVRDFTAESPLCELACLTGCATLVPFRHVNKHHI